VSEIKIIDMKPETGEFKKEIIEGLKKNPKEINPKFFYDEKGSMLFEKITETKEYYPTRTERKILEDNIGEICTYFKEGSALFEYGSGGSKKTQIILNHCKQIKAYVPMDISISALQYSSHNIAAMYPSLNVVPMCVDYTKPFKIPFLDLEGNIIAIFLGSSIGNFEPETTSRFLQTCTEMLGPEDGVLVGVDLKKDKQVLEKAYNDSESITAEFNLNLIDRINREFRLNLDKSDFKHVAFYNEKKGRIEMHIEAGRDIILDLDGNKILLKKGERIHTENSYKYDIDEFTSLAVKNHLKVRKIWKDNNNYFALFLIGI
jgi:dimethylhistidine N-methyltransferase